MKTFFYSLLLICLSHGIKAEQSLQNKIGEMLIVGFCDDTIHDENIIVKNIKKYHIGGVILLPGYGVGDERNLRNIKNPDQLAALTTALQFYAKKYRLSHEGDLFIGIDQEGGFISWLSKDKDFVHEDISAKELGRINDIDKTYHYSKSLGAYLTSLGINLNFAPVVDLAVNPNNFIYKRERCFSDNPNIVYAQSSSFVQGMHASGIITTLKHFPGHGSSLSDTHNGIADVTKTWAEFELEPYKKFISDGYDDMIMTSHVINQKLDHSITRNKLGEESPMPATFSKKMITDLLRNQLGFQGVIVTDDICMGAIADQYSLEDALKYSINAGIDMIILANHHQDQTAEAVEIIEKLVDSGEISAQRIDDSYNRILSLKKRTKTLNPNDFQICKKRLE